MRLEEERDLGGRNAHRKKTGWGHKGRRHNMETWKHGRRDTEEAREGARPNTDTTGDTYAADMTETRKHEPEIQINLEA